MDNRPQGRKKTVTGQGQATGRRGSGLGTGPVGRPGGYSGRPGTTGQSNQRTEFNTGRPSGGYEQGSTYSQSGQTATRGIFGGKGLILIIAIVAFLLLGGGGLSGLFGGLGGTESGTSATSSANSGSVNSGSSGLLSSFGSLLGNYTDSSTSTGWTRTANTGTLDTTVASGARAKRTTILGGKKDVVTIMIYMCGTDLESKSGMATSDLQEMMNATIGSNVNVLVYTGGCTAWKNSLVSNSVNQIYKVESGGLRLLVSDDGKASLTKPTTLTGFIQYCSKNYPANRYMLILWDHGGGSLSGYGYDEKNASSGSMTLKGINEALSKANVIFDFVGFDACLMATLETGLMLENYADYMIASEETEPGVGWYYTNWLTKLSANTSIPTVELGKLIVDDFVSECARSCSGQKTTLSVTDLAELAATVPQRLSAFAVDTSELIQGAGYETVSNARSGCREFATSSRIDQIDLVSFATRLGTEEGEALAQALLGAVKYNRTSSNMTDSYGLSIYFPYRKASNVSNAVSTYDAIGMDSDYTRCIQQFASVEQSGQSSSNPSSAISALFGSSSDGGFSSSLGALGSLGDISSLLGGFLGGDRSFDVDAAAGYIAEHRIDANNLRWIYSAQEGGYVLSLTEEDWRLVNNLVLNVFLDDGEGYIDLGTDNVFELSANGCLLGVYDGTWLAIDGQPIAYYYEETITDGGSTAYIGRVPILRNGEREELLIVFDDAHPDGYIAGSRNVYVDGETATVAKAVTELKEGDAIDFLCDYYRYDGTYSDTYYLGAQWIYSADYTISNVYLQGPTSAAYLLTDIYCNEYWTPEIPQR